MPWRSSERKRAYALSTTGEPASTPRKFGNCPPVASAPRSTGTDRSGAVKSSWIWNLLIEVFITGTSRSEEGQRYRPSLFLPFTFETCLRFISLSSSGRLHKGIDGVKSASARGASRLASAIWDDVSRLGTPV